jgi:hypothetical protein
MTDQIKKENKSKTNYFGISAKHDMNIERYLTKKDFRIYFIVGRKGLSSPRIDFSSLSSVLA